MSASPKEHKYAGLTRRAQPCPLQSPHSKIAQQPQMPHCALSFSHVCAVFLFARKLQSENKVFVTITTFSMADVTFPECFDTKAKVSDKSLVTMAEPCNTLGQSCNTLGQSCNTLGQPCNTLGQKFHCHVST